MLVHFDNLTLKKPAEGFNLRSVVTWVMGESGLKVFLFKKSLIVCPCKWRFAPQLDNLQVSTIEHSASSS